MSGGIQARLCRAKVPKVPDAEAATDTPAGEPVTETAAVAADEQVESVDADPEIVESVPEDAEIPIDAEIETAPVVDEDLGSQPATGDGLPREELDPEEHFVVDEPADHLVADEPADLESEGNGDR